MNTQEKEPELGEGVTSAEYWMYDGKLGRRWNVDPVDQINRSNYSVNADNPLNNIDIKGDIFGSGKEYVETYRKNLNDRTDESVKRQTEVETKIQKRRDKLAQNGRNLISDKKLNKWSQLVEDEKSIQSGLAEIREELNILEKSEWVYDISVVEANELPKEAGGVTKHSSLDNHIKINVFEGFDMIEGLSHELKHAYQFETHKLAFRGDDAVFYDFQDEVEAHKRSQFLGYYNNQVIDIDWLKSRNYSRIPPTQQVVPISMVCSDNVDENTWEMYYWLCGKTNTPISEVIIINNVNWATIYMNGHNSRTP